MFGLNALAEEAAKRAVTIYAKHGAHIDELRSIRTEDELMNSAGQADQAMVVGIELVEKTRKQNNPSALRWAQEIQAKAALIKLLLRRTVPPAKTLKP